MMLSHYSGILIPNTGEYLFRDGLINGIEWTPSTSGYSSCEINTVLKVRAYMWEGITGTGSASIAGYADLTGFKKLHFAVSGISVLNGDSPNLRVYPNYVSLQNAAPFEAVYDLSAIPDLSNTLIMIQSGHLNKQQSSGRMDASITVSAIWATR